MLIPALCDNLYLYSKIETYFTPSDYTKTRGKLVSIRNCDVHQPEQAKFDIADQVKSVYKGAKEYEAHYIWGQLVGWYKQTVDKPNASLSADRRGTLSLPDFDSFVVNSKN